MKIDENVKKAVKELYSYEGYRQITVEKSFQKYFFLARFSDKSGKKYSALVWFEWATNTATEIWMCERDDENEYVNDWLADQIYDVQYDEPEREEYQIQSDIDDSMYGYPYEEVEYLDNTDYGRWADDHEGEIVEH